MHFTSSVSTFIPFVLAVVARAAPTALDVFVPPITFPTAGTVWVSKTQQNVTWWCDRDASGAPASISNEAELFLRKDDIIAPFILAKGFDLRAGSLEITVPWVLIGSDYQLGMLIFVALLGDSGNFSPVFTIQSGPVDT
ncbi:hypothetical protein B0H19DRAFT_939079 [Mycena capillaripes]|nr:hypothetical protein B0H19DRAFT_939079 [Mycena capillaripes]